MCILSSSNDNGNVKTMPHPHMLSPSYPCTTYQILSSAADHI